MSMYEIHREVERVRAEQGDEAADRMGHSIIGGTWGMVGGAAAGAAVGSVVPGLGTAVGAVVGGAVGLFKGVQDETLADNARTGISAVKRFSSWRSK